jgi:hypothetical protein
MKSFIARLLPWLALSASVSNPLGATELYKPYAEAKFNFLYNLLFCDDLSLFRNDEALKAGEPWTTLLADAPDVKTLERIAGYEQGESRVRALAYNRLRALGHPVPAKKLLGVIVEVPLQLGPDVLAAFADGGVRYLNQSGKGGQVFEKGGAPNVEALAKQLIAASQPLVDQTSPSDKERLPPPKGPNVRLTFLVSDGLYVREGSFKELGKDPLSASVVVKATQLLQAVMAMTGKGASVKG